MIKPTRDYILVKINTIQSKGGLVLTKENQKQEFGQVISSGSDELKKGDTVYFKSYSGIPITIDDEELFFVKVDEVLGTS